MHPLRVSGERGLGQTDIRADFLAFGKPNFGEDELAAVTRTLRSGWIGMGPETILFEQELAAYIGVPHVVTVNSCTSALFLSLLVSGVKPGDEVICPSLTWCSTANAALYLGARPVFCDIDSATFCASPETILPLVTEQTKAIVVVHMGGLAADVHQLRAVLPKKIDIIEDAAHALGACYPNKKTVGSSGNLVCFSFYANKNLSTGEGGAIALHEDETAERLRSLRQHGLCSDAWKRYVNPTNALIPGVEELGYKMNYTDLQASIGRVQLRRQGEFSSARMALAAHYWEALSKPSVGFMFQHDALSSSHARHLLIVRLPIERMLMTRNEFLLALRSRNIGAAVHYPPLHAMPLYAQYSTAHLPNTDRLADQIITLPISASMTIKDVDYVIDHIKELLR
jgi:dTDP-4-amino-4,6-dideoxygalactose transaminase